MWQALILYKDLVNYGRLRNHDTKSHFQECGVLPFHVRLQYRYPERPSCPTKPGSGPNSDGPSLYVESSQCSHKEVDTASCSIAPKSVMNKMTCRHTTKCGLVKIYYPYKCKFLVKKRGEALPAGTH